MLSLPTDWEYRRAADQDEMVSGLFDLLRGQARWLLIYDNAESPAQLSGLLPSGGGGHVLVTSRWSAWGARASPLGLDVLVRAESIEFLRRRTGARDDKGLAALAELVGDLPLALEEAAAYLEETRENLDDYLELIRERSRELFELTIRPAAVTRTVTVGGSPRCGRCRWTGFTRRRQRRKRC